MSPSDNQALASEVYKCYHKLSKNGKPQNHEHTVLAAIAIGLNQLSSITADSVQNFRVVALATGTKCLGGSSRSKTGDLLNDSHAEVLTRRAFCSWLHTELQLAIQNYKTQRAQQATKRPDNKVGCTHDSAGSCTEPCFEFDVETKKFRLRPGIQVHMYISQAPCGDACIVQLDRATQDRTQCNTQHAREPPETTNANKMQDSLGVNPNLCPQHNAGPTKTSQPDLHIASIQQAGCISSEPQVKLRTGAKALRLLPEAVKDLPCHLEQNQSQQNQERSIQFAQGTLSGNKLASLGILRHQAALGPNQADVHQSISMVLDSSNAYCDQIDSTVTCPTLENKSDQTDTGLNQTVASTSPSNTARADHAPLQDGTLNSNVRAKQVYIPQAGDVEAGPQTCGVLRRKPGKGDATLSLSCSDKLARWACCGLQGSLLAGLLAEPIYLATLVVAKTDDLAKAGSDIQEAARKAVVRAIGGRLKGVVEHCLAPPYRLCIPRVGHVDPPPSTLGLCPSAQRKVGAEFSKVSPAFINDRWLLSKGADLPLQHCWVQTFVHQLSQYTA